MSRLVSLVAAAFARAVAELPNPPTKGGAIREKFYDFPDSVYDGHLQRPSSAYIDARQRATFERLLRLKKSFLPNLFRTGKERVFK